MPPKTRLELTWIGKDVQPRLEPRILLEDPKKSYHAGQRNGKKDQFENMLIHGDNLLALKSLEQEYAGKVKCIYIDPPYNTGSAMPNYDDGLEHSIWLSLMRYRLEILWSLLAPDGLMAVQIDDHEFARLYLLLIEICEERNLKTVCVKMSEATGVKMASVNKSGSIPKMKEYIILAKKNGVRGLQLEKIAKEKWDSEYRIYLENVNENEILRLKEILDDEERSQDDVQEADSICSKFVFVNMEDKMSELGVTEKTENDWKVENSWRIVRTVATTGGAKGLADKKREVIDDEVPSFIIETSRKKSYVIKNGYEQRSAQPRIKLLFADDYLTVSPGDLWTDIKTTGLGNEGGVDFLKGKKPEKLIHRIIKMSTNPGDLVLDSFAGSGTTGAVAHKMGRRWIMVELNGQCDNVIIPRLKTVINGTDSGGVTSETGWKGGGGFRYYRLAPSLLTKDKYGTWIFNKEYNAEMLSEALCKIEGFTYKPSATEYWNQGYSEENSFIYVTTQHLDVQRLHELSEEVGIKRSLLVLCASFREGTTKLPNLTVKKIPQSILSHCEWGHDDYSLKVENLPNAPKKQKQQKLFVEAEEDEE